MDAEEDSIFQSKHQCKTYYFCSEHCKTKFDASPDTYLHPEEALGTESCSDSSCDSKITFTQYTLSHAPRDHQR
jgi:Cu+-exporting ATPase